MERKRSKVASQNLYTFEEESCRSQTAKIEKGASKTVQIKKESSDPTSKKSVNLKWAVLGQFLFLLSLV